MRIVLATIICSSVLLSACSMPKLRLPRVHKLTVQQGNVITQKMVDQLKPGMTRSQVAFIMGEPIFQNSFTDERWDYIYTIELPGVFNSNTSLSLFFVDDVLAYFTGDMIPTSEALAHAEQDATDQDTSDQDTSDQAATDQGASDQLTGESGD
jgi:outer membrane protein assembly factor BamE